MSTAKGLKRLLKEKDREARMEEARWKKVLSDVQDKEDEQRRLAVEGGIYVHVVTHDRRRSMSAWAKRRLFKNAANFASEAAEYWGREQARRRRVSQNRSRK